MTRFTLEVDNNGNFRDHSNRCVILRGINIDSSAKTPATPDISTYTPVTEEFWDGENVSFVGRPFALEDAMVHFERVRSWGFNIIRYVYSWEALEHEGPGKYDDQFIDYTIEVLKIARECGLWVILDPHQDVWGRFSGGSGAPLWTYYAAGLDPRKFEATEAALVQNVWKNDQNQVCPDEFPKMVWATNYYRMACQVMFTLFFAGKEFAPKAVINGVNIQEYLQQSMLNAMVYMYKRIKTETDLFDTNVVAVETMNEPNYGLIGFMDIGLIPSNQNLRLHTTPTALQSMMLGMGRRVTVDFYSFGALGPSKAGTREIDPKGQKAWLDPTTAAKWDTRYKWDRGKDWELGRCIWAQHGVWDDKSHHDDLDTILLKPDYFSSYEGEGVDEPYFVRVFFVRYWTQFYKAMRGLLGKNVFLLCQPPVMAIPPLLKGTDTLDERVVYAPHFYDGLTLMLKKWNTMWNVDCLGYLRGKYWTPAFAIKLGETNIRKCLEEQVTMMRDEGRESFGPNIPCLMSETGMPFDMNNKKAYIDGDYSSQVKALDAISAGLEACGIHHTYWGYNSLNTHAQGDNWNGEDFSFYSSSRTPGEDGGAFDDNGLSSSESNNNNKKGPLIQVDSDVESSISSSTAQRKLLNTGTRAEEAFIRPFPTAVLGSIKSYKFDLSTITFTMEIDGEEAVDTPTEVFVPDYHFAENDMIVTVSSGKWDYDTHSSTLFWWHDSGEQTMTITSADKTAAAIGASDTCSCSIM